MGCLDQKLKLPKTCEKPLLKKIRVVLCEKPLEKRPNIREMRQFWESAILQLLEPMQREIFEKWDDFEYWKKLCPCKGYSLCKIISLGEKIKLPLPYEKRIYRQNGLTLFKKGSKNTKYAKNEIISIIGKNGLYAKAIYSLCKIISLGQKIILPKTYQKRIYEHSRVNSYIELLSATWQLSRFHHSGSKDDFAM